MAGLSRKDGKPGDEIWLLLSSAADAFEAFLFDARLTCYIGGARVDNLRAIAPNVFACAVPTGAARGVGMVRLLTRPAEHDEFEESATRQECEVPCSCSMEFEVL